MFRVWLFNRIDYSNTHDEYTAILTRLSIVYRIALVSRIFLSLFFFLSPPPRFNTVLIFYPRTTRNDDSFAGKEEETERERERVIRAGIEIAVAVIEAGRDIYTLACKSKCEYGTR